MNARNVGMIGFGVLLDALAFPAPVGVPWIALGVFPRES